MDGHRTLESTLNGIDMHEENIRQLQIEIVLAGHAGNAELPRRHLAHPDHRIRIASLSALDRLRELDDNAIRLALNDTEPAVRRRVAEIAATHRNIDVSPLLDDSEPLVVEMAAWTCGEQMEPDDEGQRVRRDFDERVIDRLIELVTLHSDPLVREAAVAALGAIGDDRAIPAIVTACSDKPAVRRRAVLALAPFSGDDVDAALHKALEDRDWQVRQAAEDVLGPQSNSTSHTLEDQQDTEEKEQN